MIINKTTKKTIASKYRRCDSLWSQAMGLRFQSSVSVPLVFTFSKSARHSFDMWFVFCPIDVVFVEKGAVVDLKSRFQPWSMYKPKKACSTVIELSAGEINRLKISEGDKISIL